MEYTQAQKDGLHGPRRNYWVIGSDGVRRGPASLDRDGVARMVARGATVVPMKRGEFFNTEIRAES